jgi:hypothetical protein
MPPEQPPLHDTPALPLATSQEALSYEPIEQDEGWLEEPEELPRRPRRRLLTPAPLTLLAVLLIACGFIGGVLVEKGQSSSGAAGGGGAGLASRFAALRGGSSSSSTGSSSTSAAGTRSGAAAGAAGGLFGGAGGAGRTAGQVSYVSGETLYVTTSEGNTVKVKTSAGTTVSKTVSSSVKSIHPGETVTVTGASAKGVVSAEAISVGSAASGLAGLFGGGGRSAAGATTSSSPALFGAGG